MPHRSSLSRVWKFVAIPLALGTSAGALFTLVQVERGKVHAALAPEPPHDARDGAGQHDLPPFAAQRAQPPARPEAALAAMAAPAMAEAASVESTAEGLVRVPDFTGKRLGQARREAKKLGIKLAARDGYGERIPAELGPYFRVRKQSSAPDSSVPRGATVEVRVRAIESYATGY